MKPLQPLRIAAVLRPGTCLASRALTRNTVNPAHREARKSESSKRQPVSIPQGARRAESSFLEAALNKAGLLSAKR